MACSTSQYDFWRPKFEKIFKNLHFPYEKIFRPTAQF